MLGLTWPGRAVTVPLSFGPRKRSPEAACCGHREVPWGPAGQPQLKAVKFLGVAGPCHFLDVITLAFLIGIVMGLANDIVPGKAAFRALESAHLRYGLLDPACFYGVSAPLALSVALGLCKMANATSSSRTPTSALP